MPAPIPLERPVTRDTLPLNDFVCIWPPKPPGHALCHIMDCSVQNEHSAGFSRRSAHKGKRMELRNHLRRKFVPRSGQDYGDKSMVYPASPAGLVLRSRVKTPSSSQSSSMAARRLSASFALKTSN